MEDYEVADLREKVEALVELFDESSNLEIDLRDGLSQLNDDIDTLVARRDTVEDLAATLDQAINSFRRGY